MKDGQDKIYYITADSFNGAKNSPHLEIFKQKGIEVLLLTDRVDEWVVSHLFEFEGKSLVSVAKGKLDLGKLDDEKPSEDEIKQQDEQAKPILEKIKTALAGKVKDVVVTTRLVDSPACLVVDNNAMSMQMERLMRQAGQEMPANQPTLEINLKHKLINKLESSIDQEQIDALSLVIFEQAQLTEGIQLDDPVGFVKRMNGFIA
jgi:molecular chaperone HtpG